MKSYEDLKSELIEIAAIVERYPDDVKKHVYELLLSKFLGESVTSDQVKEQGASKQAPAKSRSKKEASAKPQAASKAPKKKAGTESYKIDRHLDLRGGADSPSFTEFHVEKSPKSLAEFNTVAFYYLIKMKGQSEATLDQVYTCYSEVKKKPAKHFKQSFTDTQNKQGYIEFTDGGALVIPHRGVVFVEHDLPAANKEKK